MDEREYGVDAEHDEHAYDAVHDVLLARLARFGVVGAQVELNTPYRKYTSAAANIRVMSGLTIRRFTLPTKVTNGDGVVAASATFTPNTRLRKFSIGY